MTDQSWEALIAAPPYAEISQTSRHCWRIAVYHGLVIYGPDGWGWLRFSRRSAERCAKRKLARYVTSIEKPETYRIEVSGG